MIRVKKEPNLKEQIIKTTEVQPEREYEGSDEVVVSTGSTLLDLAISGGRFEAGGIPAGILVEIFGPSSSGKTVLLCEIAGGIQRLGGDIMFRDPEGRLNSQFAKIFDFNVDNVDYGMPDTVTELFEPIRSWKPKTKSKIHGIFADSLAALSTNLELDNEEGDKMGMRRAKEFSEECRKVCRVLTHNNYLMVCSNQLRGIPDAGKYAPKHKSTGGEAIGYYSSLRLKTKSPVKIAPEKTINGKKVKLPIGIETEVEVFKSSVWKPYRTAPIYILFDYGIDDIRGNLQFLKSMTKDTSYMLRGEKLGVSMADAVKAVEDGNLEQILKVETIALWNEIEDKFKVDRKPKR